MNERDIRERFSIPADYELSLDVGEPIELGIRGIGCVVFLGPGHAAILINFLHESVQRFTACGSEFNDPWTKVE